MSNIYASATAFINNHPYDVMIQAHLTVKFSSKGLAPIYEPYDPNILQKSKIPIAKMVELYTSKSSFTIINDMDVIDILHRIDAYVAEVYPLKSMNTEVETYLSRILTLRDRIYFLFRRVLNHHPQWKTSYQNRPGIFNALSILYGAIGIKLDLPESLMEDLRICPTIREYEKSKMQDLMAQPIKERVVYEV